MNNFLCSQREPIFHRAYCITCILYIKVNRFHGSCLKCVILFTALLPGTEAAHQLVICVRNKCTPEEALNVLRELPNPLREGEQPAAAQAAAYNPLKIDVFVQTLLNLGSKSISHSFAAISKFHYVFKVTVCLLKVSVVRWMVLVKTENHEKIWTE